MKDDYFRYKVVRNHNGLTTFHYTRREARAKARWVVNHVADVGTVYIVGIDADHNETDFRERVTRWRHPFTGRPNVSFSPVERQMVG